MNGVEKEINGRKRLLKEEEKEQRMSAGTANRDGRQKNANKWIRFANSYNSIEFQILYPRIMSVPKDTMCNFCIISNTKLQKQ